MVHSLELVFDPDTKSVTCRIWDQLASAGILSQEPASRSHVTLAVAEHIGAEVDQLLGPVSQRLPLDPTIGVPVLFGRVNVVFARLVVSTSDLLALHAEVHRLCFPGLSGPAASGGCPAAQHLARSVDCCTCHAGPLGLWCSTGVGFAHSGPTITD